MKALKFEDLTFEQKIGLTICATPSLGDRDLTGAIEMVKNRMLGAVYAHDPVALRKLKDVADYPLLCICSAEGGVDEATIPMQTAITAAGAKEEYAYSFGKVVASILKKKGYNCINGPVVDMPTFGNAPAGGIMRSLGSDVARTTMLAKAIARGMHDAGVLSIPKHYPGGNDVPFDSHMREGYANKTKEELLSYRLVPYIEMIKDGLLDGIMPAHRLCVNIDPERPASLSRKVLDIIREQGFDGFFFTDALAMMGIVLKYGEKDPPAMHIGAGGDLSLPWSVPVKEAHANMIDAYKRGLFTDEDLDNAVRRILAAQEKVVKYESIEPTYTEEDLKNIERINKECIYEKVEEGISPSISKDGRHFFVLMVEEQHKDCLDGEDLPGAAVGFYNPQKIAKYIKELFPNSVVRTVTQFPACDGSRLILEEQTAYDDVVFMTFYKSEAYTGREYLTTRIVDLMDALQSTERIVAHIHVGNPFVGAGAPYTPRYINAYCSADSINYALDVLAGDLEAKGIMPYDVKFFEKGHVFY